MEQDLSQKSLDVALGNVEGGTLSKCPVNWHNSPSSAYHHQAPRAGLGVYLNLPMVGSSGVQGSLCQGL